MEWLLPSTWSTPRSSASVGGCRGDACFACLVPAAQRDRGSGRLLVVQEALPPGNAPSRGKILDIVMLTVGGGEGSQAELGVLFEQAGYD